LRENVPCSEFRGATQVFVNAVRAIGKASRAVIETVNKLSSNPSHID
jgi:hypothetical protein